MGDVDDNATGGIPEINGQIEDIFGLSNHSKQGVNKYHIPTTAAEQAIDVVLRGTDQIQYTPPPYFLNWQRIAVKELSQLLVELGGGCHITIEEFTEAMEQASSQVREYAYSVRVAMPPPAPPAPSTRSIFEDF
jgi:hypothetical protein